MSMSLNEVYNMQANPHRLSCKGALHDKQYSDAQGASGLMHVPDRSIPSPGSGGPGGP